MQMASPRPPIPPVTNATLDIAYSSPWKNTQRRASQLPDSPRRHPLSQLPSVVRGSGPLLDVPTRRRLDRLEFRAAQTTTGSDLLAAVPLQPLDPVQPPAPLLLGRLIEPLAGRRRAEIRGPVAAPVLRCRVDRTGNMAARAEHEGGF